MDNNFTESLHQLVQKINDPMWTGLVYVLLGAGLFFTVATGFVQFRLLGRSIKEMLGGRKQGDDPHGITPFQAFVTGLASRVGVGTSRAWRLPSVAAGRARYFGCGSPH